MELLVLEVNKVRKENRVQLVHEVLKGATVFRVRQETLVLRAFKEQPVLKDK
jgi:hypothetical protein